MNKNIRVDNRLDAYRPFIDDAWAKQILSLSKGTPLDSFVFDLVVAWRAASYTHVLPFVMVRNLKAFVESFTNTQDPHAWKVADALAEYVEHEMGDDLNHMRRKKLREITRNLSNKIKAELDAKPVKVDEQAVWAEYLLLHPFQMSLWGSQRLCYGGVYYAYEDLFVRCYRLASGNTKERIFFNEQFTTDFRVTFNDDVLKYCWTDEEVQVARLVRHALVHNGGRMTAELNGKSHGLVVEDGEIQIMAADTKALHDTLKDRATRIVSETIGRL